ncbi:MAG TPA: hypothetical protein VG456_11020 [Candidatus Sulfopaludibacter sp.]|jgi:hypothetical protein|nr:hypothetical protein [Candidatus Sulfopaludibacter sp.]
MRYWGYFSAKLATAGAVLYGLLVLLNRVLPKGTTANQLDDLANTSLHLWTNVAIMVWFLLAAGALFLIISDQRYRCRVCLRRLRMPIETGSWGQMLQQGPPRTEYICVYGHGTLKADELQISGLANPQWTPHSDDMWEELSAASKDPGDSQ